MKVFLIILVLIISGCSREVPLHKVGDKVLVRGALHAEIIYVGWAANNVSYSVVYKGAIIKYLDEDEIQNDNSK